MEAFPAQPKHRLNHGNWSWEYHLGGPCVRHLVLFNWLCPELGRVLLVQCRVCSSPRKAVLDLWNIHRHWHGVARPKRWKMRENVPFVWVNLLLVPSPGNSILGWLFFISLFLISPFPLRDQLLGSLLAPSSVIVCSDQNSPLYLLISIITPARESFKIMI